MNNDSGSMDWDFRHLLALVRALRLAQKGNLAAGKRPDIAEAKRLEAAVDYFISEHDRRATVAGTPVGRFSVNHIR